MPELASNIDVRQALAELKNRPVYIYAQTTGGGAGLQRLLWSPPGASAVLAGCRFTYATEDTDEFVGFSLEGGYSYSSREAAIHMAMASYLRACSTREYRMRRFEQKEATSDDKFSYIIGDAYNRRPIGLGLTANVASSKEHRGSHRVHAAVMTPEGLSYVGIVIPKGAGEAAREHDGEVCDLIGLNLLLIAAGLPQVAVRGEVERDEEMGIYTIQAGRAGFRLATEKVTENELRKMFFERPVFMASGRRCGAGVLKLHPYNLNPITANPLHEAHEEHANIVEAMTGQRSAYLISATGRTGKNTPTVAQCLERVGMVLASNRLLGRERPVLVSENLALYVEMAEAYPGAGIILGADATMRILDRRWYPNGLGEVLEDFRRCGTKFYVFGRLVGGVFMSAKEAVAKAPEEWRPMFVPCNGTWDVSSTEIRERRARLA